MNPFDVTDEVRDRIADALQRGRAAVQRLRADRASTARVARAAGISEWRGEVLPWIVDHEPAALDSFFSHTELFWIGTEGRASGMDAWGIASTSATGALRTVFPSRGPWEVFAGRQGGGLLATRLPDLQLRVAEELRERSLPAALAKGILSAAMQDLIDQVEPVDSDDWWTLMRYARSVARDQFDDYISSLVSGGPLVPASSSSGERPVH